MLFDKTLSWQKYLAPTSSYVPFFSWFKFFLLIFEGSYKVFIVVILPIVKYPSVKFTTISYEPLTFIFWAGVSNCKSAHDFLN